MLTVHPSRLHIAEEKSMAVVAKKVRQWSPGLVTSCAVFHVVMSLGLWFAPERVVATQGTQPVLDLASRQVWSLVFLVVGVLVYLLHRDIPRVANLLTRSAVLCVAGMWLMAFALAVFRGEGSVVGLIVWPFLYGPWLVAMQSLGKR